MEDTIKRGAWHFILNFFNNAILPGKVWLEKNAL